MRPARPAETELLDITAARRELCPSRAFPLTHIQREGREAERRQGREREGRREGRGERGERGKREGGKMGRTPHSSCRPAGARR
eukprot:1951072-Rhodomonas_salina.1